MTVQSDLKTALDAYIQSNTSGTLTQVSASNLNLARLLEIQESLIEIGITGTVQGNLYTAIDNYIQATFTGTLAEISADKLNLKSLLSIQKSLSTIGA